eukprot:scaffold76045_cov13-Prasinocladus_malaysianus.AAC.1
MPPAPPLPTQKVHACGEGVAVVHGTRADARKSAWESQASTTSTFAATGVKPLRLMKCPR